MKTFLNVLYRRILYKIPLKRLLLGLAVFAVLFSSFSNASLSQPILLETYSNSVIGGQYENYDYNLICIENVNCRSERLRFNWNYGTGTRSSENGGEGLACGISNIIYFTSLDRCTFKIYGIKNIEYTSMQCQTEYNLIPISSVDQNYCTTNNLCPSQECPDVPIGTGNLTQLYINNILHVGAPTILMNIPDEIDWDYAYTMGGNIMNIDIVGYNVDYQVVEDEITIQKYKPSSDELSGIISGLIPLFVPGLCIILLLYFIFKFIKKVF